MRSLPVRQDPEPSGEPITFMGTYRGKYRIVGILLIIGAMVIALFAVGTVWMHADGGGWFGDGAGVGTTSTGEQTSADPIESGAPTEAPSVTDAPMPEDATPIRTLDLSAASRGESYLHNETHYAPSISALLDLPLPSEQIGEGPLVLILHTHTREGYLSESANYVEGILGDVTYSDDQTRNIVAIGEVLCKTLNERGIPTVHCRMLHDQPTLSGSYERSAETVQRYLAQYPSIRYVIDLHRDAVLNSEGEYVRSLASDTAEPTAQVMAVVGSDCNGTTHPTWERNLALALQLRRKLNAENASVCRPVSLRNSSYNQELAPYALLLEIGTGANTVEEAKRAAVLVGNALAELLQPCYFLAGQNIPYYPRL